MKLIIRSNNVMLEKYDDARPATLLIRNGLIEDILLDVNFLPSDWKDVKVQDFGNAFIFPGLIDLQTHSQVLVRGDEWEGFEYSTAAAAAGGVTCMIEMPLLSDDRSVINRLNQKFALAQKACHVDIGFCAEMSSELIEDLPLLCNHGVLGFKIYCIPCPDSRLKHVDLSDVRGIMEQIANYDREMPLIIHPEVAKEKNLYISSPYRTETLQTRLTVEKTYSVHTFAGALGEDSDDNSDESDEASDDEEDGAPLMTQKSLNGCSTPLLTKRLLPVLKNLKNNPASLIQAEKDSYQYDPKTKSTSSTKPKTPVKSNTALFDCPLGNGKDDNTIAEFDFVKPLRISKDVMFPRSDPCHDTTLRKSSDSSESDFSLFQTSGSVKKGALVRGQTDKRPTDAARSFKSDSHLEDTDNDLFEISKQYYEEEKLREIAKKSSTSSRRNTRDEDESPDELSDDGIDEVVPRMARTAKKPKPLCTDDPILESDQGEDGEGDWSPSPDSYNNFLRDIAEKEERQKKYENPIINLEKMGLRERRMLQKGKGKSLSNGGLSLNPKPIKCDPETKVVAESQSLDVRISEAKPKSLDQRSSTWESGVRINSPLTIEIAKIKSLEAEDQSKYRRYLCYLANSPAFREEHCIERLLKELSKEGYSNLCRLHIASSSSALVLPTIQRANEEHPELRLSVETHPHYIYFNDTKVEDGQTKFKCIPPIREKENGDAVLAGLKLGYINTVSSGHFPVHPKFKFLEQGSFIRAFSGVSTLGFTMQVLWSRLYPKSPDNAMKNLKRICQWCATTPSELLGISDIKGTIKVGKHADFVVWDPYKVKTITKTDIYSRFPEMNLYVGQQLHGEIIRTYVRGQLVYDREDKLSHSTKLGEIVYNKNVRRQMRQNH
eukprot:CAMPEP_0115003136 /NCGR_PEP_ID=MMETSP0216-20121206/18416_1 /TAXON_ID=223996 /ORGANISM="Protocruzia adherens, Strain Boccale" /LENGTH=888 /DNA_ID=CAMNT_0002368853 /DNA_START=39 /DNA_END=2705 /DNA_ORIENTATION=-